MQLTPGQTFYHRLSAAREAQDLATLETLYHPDAVFLSLSTGQIERGRAAILDSFKHTFQITGAISSRYEALVEAAGAVCVEDRLSTRSGEMQTYDVYLLQAGMVKQHVGGLISPRPAMGQRQGQGLPQTKGAALYHRLHAMKEAQDFARLESLYHPDIISVDCITNEVRRGRAAIIGLLKRVTANGGYVKLNSIESFVESGEIIGAEVTSTARRVIELGPVQVDALSYEVLVLRAGQIGQSFSGAIRPRGPEIQQSIQEQIKLLFETRQGDLTKIWEATHPRRFPLG